MTSLELKDQITQLEIEKRNLFESIKTETRQFTPDELKRMGEITEQIKSNNDQITEIEKEKRDLNSNIKINSNTNKMENQTQFSLLKAINAKVENRSYNEAELAVIEAGKAEMRKSGLNYSGDIILPVEERGATVATDGTHTVQNNFMNVLEPLRNNLILAQAGATVLTGLTGDVTIPAYSGSNVTWEGETSSAKDGKGTFSSVKFTPKRLTAKLPISKQFLIQDSVGAEAMLRRDLVKAIAEKLEATLLGSTAGSTTQPAGLFATAPTIKGAVSRTNILKMETALEEGNVGGTYKFIASPGAKAVLKGKDKGTDTGKYLMEGKEVEGYEVLVSNAVAKGLQTGADEFGIALGNWEDYVIAQFGALDITVDPYTLAADGQIQLVVNAYYDAKPRRTGSVVVASVK